MSEKPRPPATSGKLAARATEIPDVPEGVGPAAALPDYVAMGAAVRTDADRWPTLSSAGHEVLRAWRKHPHAPIWVHECGDLLTADDHVALDADRAALAAVSAPSGLADTGRVGHRVPSDAGPGADVPDWVERLVARSRRHTAYGRRVDARSFADLPTTSRADLVRDLAAFVPTDHPLDRVVQGTSSGSSGAALVIPLDPLELSREVVLLEHLVDEARGAWPVDPDRVGLLSVVDQRQAFTYASLLTSRGDQRMARVNLDDGAWRAPGDREEFLRRTRAQVVTGSALSLLRLARLDLDGVDDLDPVALVSGAVDLTPATRRALEHRWEKTVLDLYGLKETGPLAVSGDGGPHRVVPRRVHLEVVAASGAALPDGERGELVATVDGNPHLPLLRYRTGDTAALGWEGGRRVVLGLEGRAPVVFTAADGRAVPSVDLTQQLQHHGVHAWTVTQRGDGSVTALVLGGRVAAVRGALHTLLGGVVTVTAVGSAADLGPGKPRRFVVDAPG